MSDTEAPKAEEKVEEPKPQEEKGEAEAEEAKQPEAAAAGAEEEAEAEKKPALTIFARCLEKRAAIEVGVAAADGSNDPTAAELRAAICAALNDSNGDGAIGAGREYVPDGIRLLRGAAPMQALDSERCRADLHLTDRDQVMIVRRLGGASAGGHQSEQAEMAEAKRLVRTVAECVAASSDSSAAADSSASASAAAGGDDKKGKEGDDALPSMTAEEAALLPRSQCVRVRVDRCRDLPKVDTLGKIDAYVRVNTDQSHGDDYILLPATLREDEETAAAAYDHGNGRNMPLSYQHWYEGTGCVEKNYDPDFGTDLFLEADAVCRILPDAKKAKDLLAPRVTIEVRDWNPAPEKPERIDAVSMRAPSKSPYEPAVLHHPGDKKDDAGTPVTSAGVSHTYHLDQRWATSGFKGKLRGVMHKAKDPRVEVTVASRLVGATDVFRQMNYRLRHSQGGKQRVEGDDPATELGAAADGEGNPVFSPLLWDIVFDDLKVPDMPDPDALKRQGLFGYDTHRVDHWFAAPLVGLVPAADRDATSRRLWLRVNFRENSSLIDIHLIAAAPRTDLDDKAADVACKIATDGAALSLGDGDKQVVLAAAADGEKNGFYPAPAALMESKDTHIYRHATAKRALELNGTNEAKGDCRTNGDFDKTIPPRFKAMQAHPLRNVTHVAALKDLDTFSTDFTQVKIVLDDKHSYTFKDLGMRLPYNPHDA